MNPPSSSGRPSLHERRARRRAANRRRPDWRVLAAPAALVAVVALILVAWLVDTAIVRGETVRNVELAGRDVGGLGADDLRNIIGEIAADYGDREVQIALPDRTITTTAAEAGLVVDTDSTVDAALDEGRSGWLGRPLRWLGRWFSPATAELRFAAADLADAPALQDLEADVTAEAVNPSITFTDGEFRLVPGQPGAGISPRTVLDQLPAVAATGADPIVVAIEPSPIPPEIDDATVAAAVDDWNARTAAGLTISAGGEATRQFGAGEVRGWIDLTVDGAEVRAAIEPGALDTLFAERFGDVGDFGAPGDITIVDGVPTASGGEPGTRCCAPDSAERILAALADGTGTVALDLETVDRGDDYLEELGIVELVGEFTTEHACCESRVTNIQRLAEILRGTIIMPDERFSVNEAVGPRTTEKGFVGGGVIYQGEFRSDVGGGISQYITTFFNAVFFAGLDYDSYQAHTIYISRYPYGREATISYPQPDFIIRNTSEYPVLLWSTWTDTSITVQLYSTKHIEVEQTGQAEEAAGACTRVTTFRQRTYPDGEVVDDSVSALYQPAEGIGCDGKPTVPPTPTPIPEPTPTAAPEPTPEPTAEPTAEPEPTAVPPTPTTEPTAPPPTPTPTPEVTPTPAGPTPTPED